MNQRAGSDSPTMGSSKREKVLLHLLDQTTCFYEDTIGIFSGIFKISEFVRKGSPEADFYSYVVNVLIEESRCENASIFMIRDRHLVLKAATGTLNANANKELKMELGFGVAGKCALDGAYVLVSDTNECEFFENRPDTRVKIGSMLCVPIREGERVIGVLNLSHSRRDFFRMHDVRMFELLGLLVGQMLTLIGLYSVFQKEYLDLEEVVEEKDESLREISERYKAVVDSADELIVLVEGDRPVFVNRALSRQVGSPESLGEILDLEFIETVSGYTSSMKPGDSKNFDSNVVLGSKSRIVAECSLKKTSDTQVLLIMKDITLKKRIEQKSMQTEKLTSLGLLTSGIAHELNNKLAPILGFADLIDRSYLKKRDIERLETIIESADAARNIVGSLLTFSRNLPPEKSDFDVREIIDRTMNLYIPTIKKKGIRIEHVSSSEPLEISADMNSMEQVLVNLINNSIDALETNGGDIEIRSYGEGEFVVIDIEDTGPGLSDFVIPKVFDPFFTTKPVDRGTGLGLSICYGIVSEYRGEIVLGNTDNGCLARIRIPKLCPGARCELGSSPVDETAEVCVELDRCDFGPIMVVEDEADLLELMEEALGTSFAVESFKNGREALDHMGGSDWGLIISDLRMPEMDGMELFREVAEKHPTLAERFIFITGDTYDMQVKEFFDTTGVRFIRKPFRIKELENIVQKEIQKG